MRNTWWQKLDLDTHSCISPYTQGISENITFHIDICSRNSLCLFSFLTALNQDLSRGQTAVLSTTFAVHSEPQFVLYILLCHFHCKPFPSTLFDCGRLSKFHLTGVLWLSFCKTLLLCRMKGYCFSSSPYHAFLLVQWPSTIYSRSNVIYPTRYLGGIKTDSNTITPFKWTAIERRSINIRKSHKLSQGLTHDWLPCLQTAFSKLFLYLSFTYVRLLCLNYMQWTTS